MKETRLEDAIPGEREHARIVGRCEARAGREAQGEGKAVLGWQRGKTGAVGVVEAKVVG